MSKFNIYDLPAYGEIHPQPDIPAVVVEPHPIEQSGTDNPMVQMFSNPEFGEIRMIETDDGKMLFCGADVAKALGYAKPQNAIQAHCRGALKQGILTNGGKQEMLFIPEGDVYRLIAHSKLPNAEKFERWVFDEVLPTIRKTGSYFLANQKTPSYAIEDPVARARAWADEMEEKQKRIAMQASQIEMQTKHIQTQARQIEAQTEQLAIAAPKVEFANAISASSDAITVGELAKLIAANGIEIGGNRLFAYLRSRKYLLSSKSRWNEPTQYSMKQGLFDISEIVWYDREGNSHIKSATKVLPKGQQYFISQFLDMQKKGIDWRDYLTEE